MALKTTLTSDDINRMIAASRCQRDQLIIQFYGDTGCRVSELLAVTVDNIDFQSGTVLIPHLKRGAHKKCPNCDRSAGRVSQWCSRCGADLSKVDAEGIQEHHRIINLGKDTLSLLENFTADMAKTDKVINLSRQMVYNIVRELASAAGLDGKVLLNPESGKKHYPHPHIFRASLAVDWLAVAAGNANEQKALQEHLGHKSFDTTMKYNKLSPTEVQKVTDKVRKSRFGKKE
jgi:integrase/recombinase XerD